MTPNVDRYKSFVSPKIKTEKPLKGFTEKFDQFQSKRTREFTLGTMERSTKASGNKTKWTEKGF